MASLYPHHLQITSIQRFLLGICSTSISFVDPYRDDMVAVSGETTACSALKHMKNKMESNATGRRILSEKPHISSSTVDLRLLAGLPRSTFGRQYVDMLKKHKITPDSRKPVKFIDDPEEAYVMQRYREVHDFNHLLLDQPTNYRGEVAVKWYEAIQTNLPMCWLAAIGGTARLESKLRRRLLEHDLLWLLTCAKRSEFFMNLYFEEHFLEDIDDLRDEMNIRLSPYK